MLRSDSKTLQMYYKMIIYRLLGFDLCKVHVNLALFLDPDDKRFEYFVKFLISQVSLVSLVKLLADLFDL